MSGVPSSVAVAPSRGRAARRPRALCLACVVSAALGLGSRRPIAADPVDAPLATVERHAVRVRTTYGRDLAAEAEGRDAVDSSSFTERARRWHMTSRATGFVVKDRRTVVTVDSLAPIGRVKAIEIETAGGTRVPVSSWEFLPHAPLCVLRTATDLDVEPLAFASLAPDAALSARYVGGLAEEAGGLASWLDELNGVRRRLRDGARTATASAGVGDASEIALLLSPDGAALGVRVGRAFGFEASDVRGAAMLSDLEHSVPSTGLVERARLLHDDSFVHEVRLTFRSDDEFDDGALTFGERPPEETRCYGYSFAPNLLLVPEPIPDAQAKRIARVTIEDEGDPVIEASYEGRVRGTGAFVVKLSSATLDAPPADGAGAAPDAGHAFLVHEVVRRAGARRDRVTYDRSLGLARGYGDRLYFTPLEPVAAGSFLMDLDGKVFGVATELRPSDAEPARGDRPHAAAGDEFGTVVTLFAESGGPAAWVGSLDRRASPQKVEDSRRLPWLGVETTAVRGADVAEALELSAPTRDGTRGLVVNVVYPGSPAARAAIAVDDVLLAVRRTGGPGADAPPVDLRDLDDDASSRESAAGAPAPWSPRRTPLVTLLESFGIGAAYEIELVHEGVTRTVALTVERSPHDVESAERSRDDALGLTVKELTYEVRRALHLAPNDQGVLVSAVEDGMAAFQARVVVNEVIREADGRPVADPADFAHRVADARAAGRASMRIVVVRLDRSRFVDLRLAPCATASDSASSSAPAAPRAPAAPAAPPAPSPKSTAPRRDPVR